MADIKISEMANASTPLAGNESVEIVQSGANVKTTPQAIANTASSVSLSNTGLAVKDTDASHNLTIKPGSNLSAARTLTVHTGDADRTLTLEGDVTLPADYSDDVLAVGSLIGGVQDLTGAGAVDVGTLTTKWTTTAADAGTLADGTEGQIKIVVMVADGGDGTLTPANFANGTTITFADVGDSVMLQFLDGSWWVISNNGATVA